MWYIYIYIVPWYPLIISTRASPTHHDLCQPIGRALAPSSFVFFLPHPPPVYYFLFSIITIFSVPIFTDHGRRRFLSIHCRTNPDHRRSHWPSPHEPSSPPPTPQEPSSPPPPPHDLSSAAAPAPWFGAPRAGSNSSSPPLHLHPNPYAEWIRVGGHALSTATLPEGFGGGGVLAIPAAPVYSWRRQRRCLWPCRIRGIHSVPPQAPSTWLDGSGGDLTLSTASERCRC
jgi:hypothetical protein